MTAFTAVCLAAAVLGFGGDDAEKPDPWQKTYDAAWRTLKQGRGSEAEAMLRGVVVEAEKAGRDDLRMAKPLEELASLLLALSEQRFDEADALFERSLAIREKTQGPNHKDVAGTLLYLIEVRARRSLIGDKATTARFKRVKAILDQVRPKDDALEARFWHDSATMMLLGREYETAEKCLVKAAKCSERAFGPKSAEVAAIIDDRGDLHAVQAFLSRSLIAKVIYGAWKEKHGRLHGQKAADYYIQALTIREAVLPPDDEKIANSLANLGQIYLVLGQYKEAEQSLTRWLSVDNVSERRSDEDREHVLTMLAHSAWKRHDWAASRDWDAAAKELRTEIAAKKTADPSVQPAGFLPPAVPASPAAETDKR